MNYIRDTHKIDIAMYPQTVASATKLTRWYNVQNYRTAGFHIMTGAIADGATVVCQLKQAQDYLGTGSKIITGATCTITGNVDATAVQFQLASFTAGSSVVVNGLTFTAHATTTTVANREFSISGTDEEDATELKTCLTDPTYGVPNIYCYGSSGAVTIYSIPEGDQTFNITGVATIGVASTIYAHAYLEIEMDQLDILNDFKYVSCSCVTDDSIELSSTCIRERARYTPDQYFAAEKLGI